MSSALAMHTGDAFAPPSDQSRPKYEAAHWRFLARCGPQEAGHSGGLCRVALA